MKKQKLVTAKDTYNRIIWDKNLNSRFFKIEVENHIQENKMVTFKDLMINDDIPWHQIVRFYFKKHIVWDKVLKLDLISGSGQTLAKQYAKFQEKMLAPSTLDIQIKGLKKSATYTYDEQRKKWGRNLAHPYFELNSNIKIISYNILFDYFEQNKIESITRYEHIVSLLRESNADIIALQEVTDLFLDFLLTEKWVQDNYYICDIKKGKSISPYGQYFLCKLPFTFYYYEFNYDKKFSIMHINSNEMSIAISNIHLTSNRAKNGSVKRNKQLYTIIDMMNQIENSSITPFAGIILGDFNADEMELPILTKNLYEDVWIKNNDAQRGITFNPETNALADLNSLTGAKARYDRICLKSSENFIKEVSLFATAPVESKSILGGPLYASDHFGLQLDLDFSIQESSAFLAKLAPIYHSAIAIIPEKEVWEPIQKIRQKYDSSFERWMPHINLIYGFLPEKYFEEARILIEHALENFNDFYIEMNTFHYFTHKNSSTIWLKPETQTTKIINTLQKKLEHIFPQCNEQSSKSKKGFTPHLTVATLNKAHKSQLQKLIEELSVNWKSEKFLVKGIALISRQQNTAFEVKHFIPFKKKA